MRWPCVHSCVASVGVWLMAGESEISAALWMSTAQARIVVFKNKQTKVKIAE